MARSNRTGLTEREDRALDAWMRFHERLTTPDHLRRYSDVDHELWEAAAEGIYGKDWQRVRGWDSAQVAARVAALHAQSLGF